MNLNSRMIFPAIVLLLLLPLLLAGQTRLPLKTTSSGQGGTWEPIGPEGGSMTALIQDPGNALTLYAAASGNPCRIYKSVDFGKKWSLVSIIDNNILGLGFHPLKKSLLYAYSSTSNYDSSDPLEQSKLKAPLLYTSADGGKTWTSKALPPLYSVSKIQFDPVNSSTIHALASSTGLAGSVYLKSTNDGETWNVTVILNEQSYASAMDVDPDDPNHIIIGAYSYSFTTTTNVLYESTDGGSHFSPITLKNRSISPPNDIMFGPKGSRLVFFSMYGGIYKSTDRGKNWEKNKGTIDLAQRIWMNPTNANHMVGTQYRGLMQSEDGGVTWKTAPGKLLGNVSDGLIVGAGTKPEILITTSAGIFRTADYGKSWKASHKGIVATQVMSLRVAPSSTSTLFAALMSNAVYKTKAAAAGTVGWEQLPVFYTCVNINDILIDEKDPNKILALEGGG
ncbi:MAG: hypothetical protein V1799_16465 [bacterium]